MLPEEPAIRILNVDDDEPKRYTVTRVLRSAGFDVTETETGADALALVHTVKPDLVVLDVNLPDMSGFDVSRTLKSDPDTAAIHILHLSATSIRTSDRVEGLNAGADAYLTEPVESQELLATVNSLIRARRAEERSRRALESEREARAHAERLQAELERANDVLQEADARKDEFLAMLGHELRNPLASVRNSLHLVAHNDRNAEDRERHYQVMHRQVNHMVRMVDDLLDVARLNRNRIELRCEVMDLKQAAADASESYRAMMDERSHRFTVTLPEEPVPVFADSTRVHQVIGNILANAAKYTPAGGHVELTVGHNRDDAWISVRDSGMGIAPELLPRVFDLFTQDDRSLARSRGGLGIGLTLVKRIIDLHGGKVEARSPGLGHGSEFEIRFPSLPQAAEVRSAPAAAPPTPTTSLRVLVVEDNFDAGDTLSELIESWGHAAALARTGPEGLRMIETFPADVVILDIGLPGMDGYEVARHLRSSGFQGRLIALSGYGRHEDTAAPSESGFDARLIKPVDPSALLSLLVHHAA